MEISSKSEQNTNNAFRKERYGKYTKNQFQLSRLVIVAYVSAYKYLCLVLDEVMTYEVGIGSFVGSAERASGSVINK